MKFDGKTFTRRLLVAAFTAATVAGCATPTTLSGPVRPVYRVDAPRAHMSTEQWYAIGREHFQAGRYGLAHGAFTAMLNQNPRSVLALNGLGAVYDKLGRFDLSASYYYQALLIDPQSSRTLNNLGYSFMLQGRSEAARDVLSLARAHDPHNAIAAANLAAAAAPGTRPADGPAPVVATGKDSPIVTEAPVAPATAETAAKQVVPEPTAEPAREDLAAAGPAAVPDVPRPAAQVAPDELLPATSTGTADATPAVEEMAATPMPTIANAATTAGPEATAAATTEVGQAVPLPREVEETASGGVTLTFQGEAGGIVEIANGNGFEGMARLLADYYTQRGHAVERVSNAARFDHDRTVIEYRPGARALATAMCRELPVPVELVARDDPADGVDVRLVVGHELGWYQHAIAGTNSGVGAPHRPIEVSNGNGRNGMAQRVSEVLARMGETIGAITNAANFEFPRSVLFHAPGEEAAAHALADRLPVAPQLRESTATRPGIPLRLVIGADLLPFERAIRVLGEHDA